MPTGKTAPSIRAALVIEPNEPLENQDHDDDKTMIDEDLATQFVDDQPMDMVKHGLLNRWTDIFILPRTPWGLTFNPNNGTKIQLIFVKLSENIFLGMSKVRAWLIFTLSMP